MSPVSIRVGNVFLMWANFAVEIESIDETIIKVRRLDVTRYVPSEHSISIDRINMHLTPIFLDGNWLRKLGAVEMFEDTYRLLFPKWSCSAILTLSDGYVSRFEFASYDCTFTMPLHELQNFYHYANGIELEISK